MHDIVQVVGFDTAEREPCKVCPLSVYRSSRSKITQATSVPLTVNGKTLEPTGEPEFHTLTLGPTPAPTPEPTPPTPYPIYGSVYR